MIHGYSRAFQGLYGLKPIEKGNRMNERIKELADEAARFSAVMALPTGKSGNELFVERFAELIVRDCVNAAEEAQADFYVVNNIKTRFGVEEEHDELPSYNPNVDG